MTLHDLPLPPAPPDLALPAAEEAVVHVETQGGQVKILYDARGAAEMLSMSQRHLDDLRRAGKIIAVQEGRGFKYRHEDLVAFAEKLPTSAEAS